VRCFEMEKGVRKNIMLSKEVMNKLENYMTAHHFNERNFSQVIALAIEKMCDEETASNDHIEKRLNAIAKEVRLGNIVQLRAFHNLNVDVEDMSFDLHNTQLGFLADIDFDAESKKSQYEESIRKTKNSKTSNPLFPQF